MYTAEIRDGVVVNLIMIQENERARYERTTGNVLVDYPEQLGVDIGDAYDSESGVFSRGGVNLVALNAIAVRDGFLAASDYLIMPDYPLTDEARAQVIAYRRSLRSLPESDGWPDDITWPTQPEIKPGDSLWDIVDDMIGGE